jgi:hypothetical protein
MRNKEPGMVGDWVPFHALLGAGWALDSTKGVVTKHFASVSLCLAREGERIVCVPGYGRTRDKAISEATDAANMWLNNHPEPRKVRINER